MLATVGSLGDLHPFIALGRALRARGADVVLACAAEYRLKVEQAGLVFRPVRPSFADMEQLLGMDRVQLTRSVLQRGDFLLRKLVAPSVRVSYQDMLGIIEGADLVLASSLCVGARLACERRAVPWIGIVLQPMMFLSAYDPPVIPHAEWLGRVFRLLGPAATAPLLAVFKQVAGGLLTPLRALRREIGLPPSGRNPLFEGQFGADGAIALYSSALGGIQPDYPQPTAIVGFASFDSDDGGNAVLEPPLQAFLTAGPPPLVFTLGSLIVNSPGSFYRESLEAARRLGMRAVLLVGEHALKDYAPLGGAAVHVAAYAPYSLLFPRAAAIVHQAGIGTLAEALRSGRPHLAVPFYADQADNAARAVRLGVARSLAPARYAARAAAHELELLTTRSEYGSRAGELRARLSREDGAVAAADIILNRLESRDR